MNKKGPSQSLIMCSLCSCAVYITENIKKWMSTAYWSVIGRNICVITDHCDITSKNAACVSYLWYSLTRMLNPEDGGNSTLRSIWKCAKSHKNRTVSTQQQHSRQNLKSGNSKGCWLDWAITLSLLSYWRGFSCSVKMWVCKLLVCC